MTLAKIRFSFESNNKIKDLNAKNYFAIFNVISFLLCKYIKHLIAKFLFHMQKIQHLILYKGYVEKFDFLFRKKSFSVLYETYFIFFIIYYQQTILCEIIFFRQILKIWKPKWTSDFPNGLIDQISRIETFENPLIITENFIF